jgi:hypothetical protein
VAKKIDLTGLDESSILDMMGVNSIAASVKTVQPAQKQDNQAEVSPEAPKEPTAIKTVQPAQKQDNQAEVSPKEPKEPTAAQTEEQAPYVAESEKATTPNKRRKKTYEETFLSVRNIGSLRRHVTLSPDLYDRLDAIVRIALNGRISLSNFIDNILNHHIDEYNEDLKALLNNQTYNFLK